MANTKRQHTVPRTYLELFANRRKDQFYIYTFDKKINKLFEDNIVKVAVEKDIYTLKMNQNEMAWEEFYSNQIEPRYQNSVHMLVKQAESTILMNRADIITYQMKIELAIIIMYQLFRCKKTIKITQAFADGILPEVLEDAKEKYGNSGDVEKDEFVRNFYPSQDFLKSIYADVLTNPNRIVNYSKLIANRCWVLYRIIGEKEFVTSDNPVTIGSLINEALESSQLAFLRHRSVLYYPLSPKLLIAVYDHNIWFGAIENNSNCIIDLKVKSESSFIDSINHLFIQQSNRQTFSKSIDTLQTII